MSDSPPKFIHLRLHSAYSLLEGAIRIKDIPKLCKANGMPAIALTDTANLFGALEFSETLAKEGIQPITGCTLPVLLDTSDEPTRGPIRREPSGNLALLAKDERGYENLMKLSSLAFLGPDAAEPAHVTMEKVEEFQEGLICLTGGPDGLVNRLIEAGQPDAAAELLLRLKRIFGDRLYVELQRHDLPREQIVEGPLIELAYKHELPLVATNEPYFTRESEYEAHDALICIAAGAYVVQSDRRRLTPQHRFKSQDEMAALFADLPEAIENTVEIARRCAYRPQTRNPILPKFAAGTSEADELRRQAEEGLTMRLATLEAVAPEEEYRARLNFELDVIIKMDFPGYFLIVADFIKWAKGQGIPVGPGRGSGAGSVVAWALTITDLDPLRFGLLFERFLNPERVSMPDFDIDFCQDRRDEVIRYVQARYGEDKVAQIITFGKLQARAVLRDVGRVLQMPYGQVDRLCKLVPNNPAAPVTLPEAIKGEPRLQEEQRADETVAKLLEIGQSLEGLYRHASTHAAGVVIGDRPLDELVPLYRDPRSDMPVTQFNMKWVEPAGLVKFDFLGLKTLTVLDRAVKLLARRDIQIDLLNLPLADEKTFAMLGRGETIGVFQLESSGMRDVLRKLEADRFEDIIALVALYRPGPMDNIPSYVKRKHGTEKPDYLHPLLEPVLKETHGVIIYQEQVMQIAQILSGYSLGEADLLRRAMGKKIKAEMEAQKERFVTGAVAKQIDKAQAASIFELVDKFAGYGFNKSHAAAYALVAYQTAWLKANHPVEFLAASMSLDLGNTDKLGLFKQEAERLGLKVRRPCINRSEGLFGVADGEILYALAAIKNVGLQAMEHIVEVRREGGPFRDLFDFARRINPRLINKRTFENLARAGAFDALNPNRAQVLAAADLLLGTANVAAQERESKQVGLFGEESGVAAAHPALPAIEPWLPMDRLTEEFNAVGFYLSGHPLDDYRTALQRAGVVTYAELLGKTSTAAKIAGTVTAKQERKSKKGNPFAFLSLSDPTGQFEIVVFSEVLAQSRQLMEPGSAVVLNVEIERIGEEVKLRAQSLRSVDEVVKDTGAGLKIFIEDKSSIEPLKSRLAERGKGIVSLILMTEGGGEVELKLKDRYRVTPQLRGAIKSVPGIVEIQDI
ncbi:DNA polymerase III, alpha subunit [Parvibaculum lavamentivorans DS-1]|uniref:DNA polymerase III subunit alpha n=1 Tax=Parvibaculum lavamentivorans (strain DS-1 / DSM 13023 / NCIMB 13966) TaxID=402881 RepID=A7HY20_PARL1|nr:DNA polymerase III subunit alpha [Parvibaculum lavamentivorans]ABS64803.1 DNA polymerase III, alpha subunit [Parvibaculum lavamentivorans DS-1]